MHEELLRQVVGLEYQALALAGAPLTTLAVGWLLRTLAVRLRDRHVSAEAARLVSWAMQAIPDKSLRYGEVAAALSRRFPMLSGEQIEVLIESEVLGLKTALRGAGMGAPASITTATSRALTTPHAGGGAYHDDACGVRDTCGAHAIRVRCAGRGWREIERGDGACGNGDTGRSTVVRAAHRSVGRPMAEPEEKTERVQIVAGLSEAMVDGERRAVDVVCIRPGLSKNGNYYAPGVVRAMAPLFEGARAFADHPAPGERPERSIRDIVGYYRAPRVDEDGALRATLKVARHADWLWSLMREAVEDGQPDLIGISIDADARVAPAQMEGRRVRVVEAITRLNSCDVVTRASAGGRIERVLQAEGGDVEDEISPRRHGGTEMARSGGEREGVAMAVMEERQQQQEGAVTGQETNTLRVPSVSPCLRGEDTLESLREEIRRERRALACERLLDTALRESGLPAPIRDRLERRFRGQVFEAGALDEAMADERAVLAALSEQGLVRGMGFEKGLPTSWGPRLGMSEAERLQKAFDQLFDVQEGERVPALSGLREAYVAATGDAGITGISAPERLREADVTTASFSYLLGTSMNKRLLKDYQSWPAEWTRFCTVTSIKDFKQQDRIRLGAFGSLSTVAEDAAYTTLTLSDTRATYAATKRGNLVAVTRETVINDDLHAIKQIPGKLAVAAAFTLAEFVYGFLTATANIYDGSPLFTKGGAHNNSAVTTPGTANSGAALASASMQSGVTAMRRQTNMAGKPIGLKPRFLIVPPELEWQAMVVTKSAGIPGSNFNDVNPMQGYAEVVVAPQLASATGWYLAADPRVVDTVEIGFVGGQETPAFFVQDVPTYGNNFTNDVITYKVRHEYGGAVVDYRGFYQGNN